MRLRRSGNDPSGLIVLDELDQLYGLHGADHDIPTGQLGLDFALHDGNLAGNDQGAGPVSYTHLDVYKRQPLYILHHRCKKTLKIAYFPA